jgi:hypothetical protein
MSEKKKSEFGIWKKSVRLKSGEESEVLSFSVNGVRYNAWPNKYKSSEKAPDYNVYVDDYVKPDTAVKPNNPAYSKPAQSPVAKQETEDFGLPF